MDLDGTYVRVCPDCHAEFVATVEVCFDCDTPLETRLADGSADPAAAALAQASPAAGAEPPAGWVPIQTADLDWALELKERLAAAGIVARLSSDCASCRPTLGVYVAPDDLAAANAVAQDLYVQKVPEAAASQVFQEADRCPACGAGLSERATSCPDCGLAFLEVEEPDEERRP